MHIQDFVGLHGKELARKQENVFFVFLMHSKDIGLGALTTTHVKGAVYLIQQRADAKGLKIVHPVGSLFPGSDDTLPQSEVFKIAALSWHAWGVLNDKVADYGVHLITFAMQLFYRKIDDPAIHTLPYMQEWFASSLSRDDDPMYGQYKSWVMQLKFELDSVKNLTSGSNESEKEVIALKNARTERLSKAESREDDWLVEWLETSVDCKAKKWYNPAYNVFQVIVLNSCGTSSY